VRYYRLSYHVYTRHTHAHTHTMSSVSSVSSTPSRSTRRRVETKEPPLDDDAVLDDNTSASDSDEEDESDDEYDDDQLEYLSDSTDGSESDETLATMASDAATTAADAVQAAAAAAEYAATADERRAKRREFKAKVRQLRKDTSDLFEATVITCAGIVAIATRSQDMTDEDNDADFSINEYLCSAAHRMTAPELALLLKTWDTVKGRALFGPILEGEDLCAVVGDDAANMTVAQLAVLEKAPRCAPVHAWNSLVETFHFGRVAKVVTWEDVKILASLYRNLVAKLE
jgi:hypothetical protein